MNHNLKEKPASCKLKPKSGTGEAEAKPTKKAIPRKPASSKKKKGKATI